MYVCMYVSMYVCVYVCMYVCTLKTMKEFEQFTLRTRTLAQTFTNQIFESKDSTRSTKFNWIEG